MDYKPIFQVTSRIIKNLGKIEAVKEIVEMLVIPIALEEATDRRYRKLKRSGELVTVTTEQLRKMIG